MDGPAGAADLGALLVAWRGCRDGALGDLAAELGARLARGRVPPAGRTRAAAIAAWCAALADPDPVILSVLLPSLAAGNSKEALARLEALVSVEPDPRVSRALVALFAAPPFQAGTTKPFWKLAAAELARHGDPAVDGVLAGLEGTMTTRLGGAETMGAALEKLLAAARRGQPGASAVPADVALLVDRVVASRPDPLEEALAVLRAVPWATLDDAYGPAEAVPALLEAVATGSPDERRAAWGSLWGNVFHQGSVYPATPPAARFLVAMLGLAPPDPVELLRYLVHLAVNEPGAMSLAGDCPWSGASDEDEDSAPFVRTYREVAAAGPVAVRLIEDDDPAVRIHATFLLAFLREHAPAATRALRRRLASEADPEVEASLCLALGLLGRATGSRADGPELARRARIGEGLVRIAAALAVGHVERSEIPGDLLAVVREVARGAVRFDAARVPWADGDLSRAARDLDDWLDLQPPEVLLDDLEWVAAGDDGRAFDQRKLALQRRLFGGEWRPTPKHLRGDLDPHQLRFCGILVARGQRLEDEYQGWPHLEHLGLFLASSSLRRWWVGDAGPLDTPTADGRPAWKVMSDALYGHVPRDEGLRILGGLGAEALAEIVAECRSEGQTWRPYELERHARHVVEDVGPLGHRLDLEVRHNDRYVDLLAELAVLAGARGLAVVDRIGERELELIRSGRYPSGAGCALAATTFARWALRSDTALDPRVEGWLAETITTSPIQRTPRRTEEGLRVLPPERAEALILDVCPIWSEGRVTHDDQSWVSMHFDDTLRFTRLLERPPAAVIDRVVAAIERWAWVKGQIPNGEVGAEPLPEEELAAWFAWAGAAARPALEASVGKGHRAAAVMRRFLATLG